MLPTFIGRVCQEWGLYNPMQQVHEVDPTLAPPLPPRVEKRARIRNHPLESLPESHGEGSATIRLGGSSRYFVFITDCKPLADVISGHTALKTEDLAPMFSRITSNLFSMLSMGWSPPRLVGDPVVWHRREFNKIADYIVNHTMDAKRSWHQKFMPQVHNFNIAEANLIIHTDGGTRAGQCSASAWYVEACVIRDGHAHTFPLAMAGTFLVNPVSSFLSESVALDESTEFIIQLLQNIWSTRGAAQTKRHRVTRPFS